MIITHQPRDIPIANGHETRYCGQSLSRSMLPVEVEIQPIKQPVPGWLSLRTWMIISGFE